MVAKIEPGSGARSRRAVLVGALGGIGAWMAGAIGHAGSARAADGATVIVGDNTLTAESMTKITNGTNDENVFAAESTGAGAGLSGVSNTFHGVVGSSASNAGVFGSSQSRHGVLGLSNATDHPAVMGQSVGNQTGVHGFSGDDLVLPAAKAKTGVYGYAAQDDESKGVYGESPQGFGVYGTSGFIGVLGTGANIGVNGFSSEFIGLYGDSTAPNAPATLGHSYAHSTGVLGYSGGFENPPAAKANTGVYGNAANGTGSKGVWGKSPAGHGVHGESSTGWAGYFDGRVLVDRYLEMVEVSTPSAPGSNHARLFIRDNGSGKTQLCVRFHTGAVRVLATQP